VTGVEDLESTLRSVIRTLEAHGVPYFVTGSLASSMHAEFRATNDIDLVADFGSVDLRALMGAFGTDFHADLEQALQAVPQGMAFNLIHRTSYLKVDLFPVASEFNRMALARAERVVLGDAGLTLQVSTREDILLAKLWWYRLGGESSDRQRGDVEGIIALNRELLDVAYVRQWAAELGVQDLLVQFLDSPGLK